MRVDLFRRVFPCFSPHLLFLIFHVSSPAAQPVEEDPNFFNAAGVRATQAGDFGKAVEYFRRAFEIEPDAAKLKFNLFTALKNQSIALAKSGDAAGAIVACSEALSLFQEITVASNLAVFFEHRAIEHLNRNDFEQAKEAIETSQEIVERFRLNRVEPRIRKTRARIYLLEARNAFLKEDARKALELYDQSIRINPDEELAYLDRSAIYYERDSHHDAVHDLEEVLRIRGSPRDEKILALIERIRLEARAAGNPVPENVDFFRMETIGNVHRLAGQIRRLLQEIRVRVSRDLQVDPHEEIIVVVDGSQSFVPLNGWLSQPGSRLSSARIQIGAKGIDLNSPELLEVLRFHYVFALLLTLSEERVPYWFAAGLAQIQATGKEGLEESESAQLITAGENGLLLRMEDISWINVSHLEDSGLLRLAHLASKGLVSQLYQTIRPEGIGQLIRALEKGIGFNQALQDVANLTSEEIELEWRRSLGLA